MTGTRQVPAETVFHARRSFDLLRPHIDNIPRFAAYFAKSPSYARAKENYTAVMETLLDTDTVELIRDYVPRNATLHMLSEFFGACADATRAKIICALSISEMCVGDLARVLGLNQTTCSHQLRLLRAAEIVRARREGKVIYYSLKNRKIEDVMYAGVRFLGL